MTFAFGIGWFICHDLSNHVNGGRQFNIFGEIHYRHQGRTIRLYLGGLVVDRRSLGSYFDCFRDLGDGFAPSNMLRCGVDYFPFLELKFHLVRMVCYSGENWGAVLVISFAVEWRLGPWVLGPAARARSELVDLHSFHLLQLR